MRALPWLLMMAVIASCGPVEKCNRASCSGCCDNNDVCQLGNNQSACGTGGLQCQICPQTTLCSVGFCALTGGTGGGSGGGTGGSGGGTGGGFGGGSGGGFGGGSGGGFGGGSGGGFGGGTGGGFGGGTGGGAGNNSYTIDGVVFSSPSVSCQDTTGSTYQFLIASESPAPSFIAYFPTGPIPSQTWSCVPMPASLQAGQSTIALSGSGSEIHICQAGTVTTTMTAGKLTVIVNNLTLNRLSGDGGVPTKTVSARLTCP